MMSASSPRRPFVAMLGAATMACAFGAAMTGPPLDAIGGPREAAIQPTSSTVRFEPNLGQFPPDIRFVGRGAATDVTLTDHGATFVHPGRTVDGSACTASIEMTFDATSSPQAHGRLASVSNFFLGNDPSRWRSSVPNFAEVSFDASKGERVSFHGSKEGELEYDVDLPANVDASTITITVPNGALSLRDGDLVARTPCGEFVQKRPRAFQRGRELSAEFFLKGRDAIGFTVVDRDHTAALTIDPTVLFATGLPGLDASIARVATDAAGHTYLASSATAQLFPTTVNAYQTTTNGLRDVTLTKFAADGSSLVWSTYIGGNDYESARGIAVDTAENVYLAGSTSSTTFPTLNAIKPTFQGQEQAFVVKVNASGSSLAYSTFLGGTYWTDAMGVTVDSTGAAYVVGETEDADFPVTSGAFQSVYEGQYDAFITKISPSGLTLDFSTYFGGFGGDNVYAVALGPDGSIYVTGRTSSQDLALVNPFQSTYMQHDSFVARFSADASVLLFSSYLGGSMVEYPGSIVVNSAGDAFAVGATSSVDFPVKNAYQAARSGPRDAYLTKVSASGALLASTYFGGSGDEADVTGALRPDGQVVISGFTTSGDLPLVRPLQQGLLAQSDAFVTRFDPTLASPTSSTFFGGASFDGASSVAVDPSSNLYLCGSTGLGAFPFKNPLYNSTPGVWITKWVPMSLAPPEASVPPRGSVSFTTTEGAGGYVYSFVANASGGSIGAGTGVYTAGTIGSTIDTIKVVDSSGTTSDATIKVGPGVTIAPASPTPAPKSAIAFSAIGGSGTGFTWTLPSNNSGATLNASTGAYLAGSIPNVTDVVVVTDSLGNTATTNVLVGPGISISPGAPAAPPNGSLTFTATGGSGVGFVWALAANASGATMSPTGSYKAGPNANVVDAVSVTDSVGNAASVVVSVGGGLAINPASPTTPPRGAIAFVGTGGGASHTWKLATNASGGSIDGSTGAYRAGDKGSTVDVVALSDGIGNSSSVTIVVGPGISVSPAIANIAVKSTVQLFASGGVGHDYVWQLVANGSGGSIDPKTGMYSSGTFGGSVDEVRVSDPLGNEARVLVLVDAVVVPPTPPPEPTGCACELAATRSHSRFPWLLAIAGPLVAALRRRRRRCTPPITSSIHREIPRSSVGLSRAESCEWEAVQLD